MKAHRDVLKLPDERLREAYTLFVATMHHAPPDDDGWALASALYQPGRTFAAVAGADIVGSTMSTATTAAVPGGGVLPMAAVTRVAVRPDHTRRGILTEMMAAQLREFAARDEPLASLRASEAQIYGRFGYGVATRYQTLTVARRGAAIRPGAPAGGSIRMLAREDMAVTLAELHDRTALDRPGGIRRTDAWWQSGLRRWLANGDHIQAAVHTGPDGDDGFVVWTINAGGPGHTKVQVGDMQASSSAAATGLWRFLLSLDLTDEVRAPGRPLDDPATLLLTDRRACQVGEVADETWLRLVDVEAALTARGWAPDVEPVVLGVHDGLLPANSGAYRISGKGVERVDADPELECDVAALSMAYLGDTAPSVLAATGWLSVRDAPALARADLLFGTAVVPWCGTFF